MKLLIICTVLIIAIFIAIWIIYEVENAMEAIEDEDGNIIGYK
jgi:hypothetical protein